MRNLGLGDPAFLAAAGGGLWTPANTATAIWLDASDAATITQSSNLISQWNDKSGNGRNVTASGTARPTLVSNGLNSLPIIRFPTGTQVFTFAQTYSGHQNTYMMLLSRESTGNITPLIASATSFAYLHYGNTWHTSDSSATATPTSTVTMNANTWYANVSVSGTKFSNGSSVPASGTSANSSSFTTINASFSNNAWNLAQFIFFAGSVSADIRQRVEGYWAHRYGLTASLPSNHPYKSSPPTL